MAKIYNFHIYQTKAEPVNFEDELEFENFDIKIVNGKTSELEEGIFKDNNNVAIINEIDPPGDKGGGGDICDLMQHLESFFYIGMTVIFTATSSGFFGELGKDLYRKSLSVLFDKEMPTKLIIERKHRQSLEIIIPPKTDMSNLKNVEDYLNNVGNKCGKVIYDPKSKNFVYMEEYNYIENEDEILG